MTSASRGKQAPPDQDQRDLIVSELDRNMLVEAAAGTGKTTSMVSRMVELLAKGKCESINRLVAVTFTRKAAAELRAKFRIRLERESSSRGGQEKKRLEAALADIDKCFIGTIHSFCARLLRERPVEAGIDVAFTELDEIEDARLRDEAWDTFIGGLIVDDPEGVLDEIESLGLTLPSLKEPFKKFLDYPDVDIWPLPSESEKISAAKALKEINKVISHMRDLSKELPPTLGGDNLVPLFHKAPRIFSHFNDLENLNQLEEMLKVLKKKPDVKCTLWEKQGICSKEEAKQEGHSYEKFQENVVIPVLNQIGEAKYAPIIRVFERARKVYDPLRIERGYLNYQDLLMKAADLLREQPHVREYFSRRFSHLLVDEFQDTDPIQAEVMVLLTSSDKSERDWRKCRPRPGSLFVVGDPKQSIYRFRRADIVTYNQVKEIIEKGDGKKSKGLVVELSANFRTTGDIIDWVNEVFQPSGEEDANKKAMLRFPEAPSDESPEYVPLQKGREEGCDGELKGLYRITIPGEFGNAEIIADYDSDFIARFIRDAVDSGMTVPRSRNEIENGKDEKVDYSDFMIVTKSTFRLSKYAAGLQEYGIPHQVTGGTALNEVAELKLLHICLSAIVRPDDPVALVGALRSELFGISDAALYRFKKTGGRFSFNSDVPASLDQKDGQAFSWAFGKLRKYSAWLSEMPPTAAIEKVVSNLGLMLLAGSREGGDIQAGGIAKTIEILRGMEDELWTVAHLVDYLGRLVEVEEKYDGISVRSEQRPFVRVMNLHKVKGLEAPVVFLADPSGESDHGAEVHIDRSGEKTTGYISIGQKIPNRKATEIARPPDWDRLGEVEKEFMRAEELRLRYVAATRAGSALIVSQRTKCKGNNPWHYFEEHIPDEAEIEDPGAQKAPKQRQVTISRKQIAKAAEAIQTKLDAVRTRTYEIVAAKELALSDENGETKKEGEDVREETLASNVPASGEHGAEWGSVIHTLLQVAMKDPKAELVSLAETALEKQDMDKALANEAIETVRSVMSSELWERAQKSDKRFTEVPFQLMHDNAEVPTVIRGVIDLVFREDGGWVLVDYKTDFYKGKVPKGLVMKYRPQLDLYAKAWERTTGEPVAKKALFFTRTGSLVSCD